MMKEIEGAEKESCPFREPLFVSWIRCRSGCGEYCKASSERLNFDGVVLTKLDVDTARWSRRFPSDT